MMEYNYDIPKAYCQKIGLVWPNDAYLKNIDAGAKAQGFSQMQVDWAMMQLLNHVKTLFTPANYGFLGRLVVAFFFLTGIKLKNK